MKNSIKTFAFALFLFVCANALQAQQKIAYIYSDSLIVLMPEKQMADSTIEQFRKKYEDALARKEDDYNKKYKEYQEAITKNKYNCFLNPSTTLPMMYMKDAIRATIELMESETKKIKIRSSYNLGGISFSPKEIGDEIKKHIPKFNISYNEDFRQKIASSWPNSIDDSYAKNDWNWENKIDLKHIVKTMLENV